MSIKLKCLSHTPLRGLNDPGVDVVQEVDAVLAKCRAEVEAFDPELIVVFAPDHYNGLFYDLMPPFVIATAAESVADYKTLPGPLSIPKDLALELARFILDSDIDIAISHRLQVDHGCTQTLEEMTGSLTRLSHEPPVPLLADAADDIANFLIAGRNPTPEGRAARQARTIATGKVFGTPECALTPLNAAWDLAFMDTLMQGRLSEIDDFKIEEISKAAGRSTHEVRTWVAAFSALAAAGSYTAHKDYYRPINEWIAGYGVVSAEQS